jgi:hypothetical protein
MGGRRGGGGGADAGGPPPAQQITNGKITGDSIYFEVSRAGRNGGDPTVTKYEGTVSGDTMKLKVTRPGRGGGEELTSTGGEIPAAFPTGFVRKGRSFFVGLVSTF